MHKLIVKIFFIVTIAALIIRCSDVHQNDDVVNSFLIGFKKGESTKALVRNYFLCSDTILKNEKILAEIFEEFGTLRGVKSTITNIKKNDSSSVYKVTFFLDDKSLKTMFILSKENKIVSINPVKKDQDIIMWYIPCESL